MPSNTKIYLDLSKGCLSVEVQVGSTSILTRHNWSSELPLTLVTIESLKKTFEPAPISIHTLLPLLDALAKMPKRTRLNLYMEV